MTAKKNASLEKDLKTVYATLDEVERYNHVPADEVKKVYFGCGKSLCQSEVFERMG